MDVTVEPFYVLTCCPCLSVCHTLRRKIFQTSGNILHFNSTVELSTFPNTTYPNHVSEQTLDAMSINCPSVPVPVSATQEDINAAQVLLSLGTPTPEPPERERHAVRFDHEVQVQVFRRTVRLACLL
jgi:hypothetical protein